MVENVFDPLTNAMVTMTVGTIQMNRIVEVNSIMDDKRVFIMSKQ